MILALVIGTLSAGGMIEGLEPLIRPGTTLLLGEIHGTAESPAFVSRVARSALGRDLRVIVALELPQADQGRIEALLASEGTAEDVDRFLESPFWSQNYQDGRASEAMLALLLDLRAWRAAGQPVRAIAIDIVSAGRRRDAEMAARLLAERKRSPSDFIVSLTGNLHNRTADRSGRMGEIVSKEPDAGRVVSLNVSHAGGTSWLCTPSGCGEVGLKGRDREAGRRVRLLDAPDGAGHHGTYHVGTITASLPARIVRAARPGSDQRP